MSDAPWTRAEQINYATFGTREDVPEWDAVWTALWAFGNATGYVYAPGGDLLTHFIHYHKVHTSASMSVD